MDSLLLPIVAVIQWLTYKFIFPCDRKRKHYSQLTCLATTNHEHIILSTIINGIDVDYGDSAISSSSSSSVRVETYAVLYRQRTEPNKVILYSHGNDSSIETLHERSCQMRDIFNVDVCVYEYPEHPDQHKINAVIDVCYQQLVARGYQQIIIWGKSIGTGPSCWLAARQCMVGRPEASRPEVDHSEVNQRLTNQPVIKLVLIAAYTTFHDILTSTYWYLPWLKYAIPNLWDNKRSIDRVSCPIYLFHGDADTTIPCQQSVSLYSASVACQDKQLFILAGIDHEIYYEAVLAKLYLDSVLGCSG